MGGEMSEGLQIAVVLAITCVLVYVVYRSYFQKSSKGKSGAGKPTKRKH